MHERCAQCAQNFEPEPGYYFGAMFISYIWSGWLCLFLAAFTILVLEWSINASLGAIIGLYIISYFWVLRISRSMYIHFDVKYAPQN